MRTTSRALAALLASALAACGSGKDAPAPVQVTLTFADVDRGGPTEGYSIVSEDGKVTAPLVLETGRETQVFAAKAPGGRYRLVCPEGWAAVGPYQPPVLRSDLPPQSFWVGRPRTVYVGAPLDHPVEAADVTRVGHGIDRVSVTVEIQAGKDGQAALRFRPEDWRDQADLVLRLGPSLLTKAVTVHFPPDGAPVTFMADPAAVVPLDVVAIRAPGGDPAAALEVAASASLGRLVTRAVGKTDSRGRARISEVPTDAEDFWLSALVPAAPPLRFDGKRFRFLGEARLLVPSGDPSTAGMLSVKGWPRAGALVQARPEGAGGYGALPGVWAPDGKGYRFDCALPAGRTSLLVTDGEDSARSDGPVSVSAGGRVEATLVPEPISTVSVRIRGGFATPQARYDLICRLVEGGEEVDLVAGTMRYLTRRDQILLLPRGLWRLHLEHGDASGPLKDLSLDSAGTRASMDLDAPR